jgi:hypothetical protein
MSTVIESARDTASAVLDRVVRAGDGWCAPLRAGQVLRIVDLEGNQAVDTLFYALDDPAERYDACATMRSQGALYLGAGSRLLSDRGRALLTIVADTCGRHDTLGGACSCESNQVRYALDKRWMHSCRDTFLLELAKAGRGLTKRDLGHNINFFMNVPVTPTGELTFADGISAAGRYVELRAEVDTLVLISNCPQLNNPCNGWNPTPVRLLVWDA